MKKLSFMTFLLVLGPFFGAHASTRCEQAGGKVLSAKPSVGDAVELCVFGKALISLDTFENTMGEAIDSYLDPSPVHAGPIRPTARGGSSTSARPNVDYIVCTSNSGAYVGGYRIEDSETFKFPVSICSFKDGSAIEAHTLALGKEFEGNADLTRALLKP